MNTTTNHHHTGGTTAMTKNPNTCIVEIITTHGATTYAKWNELTSSIDLVEAKRHATRFTGYSDALASTLAAAAAAVAIGAIGEVRIVRNAA